MNIDITNYVKLKEAGHVTIGDAVAANKELTKIYEKDGQLYCDLTTFDPSTGEEKTQTEVRVDLTALNSQFGQFLKQRAELRQQLNQLEAAIPGYKAFIKDLEALYEKAAEGNA